MMRLSGIDSHYDSLNGGQVLDTMAEQPPIPIAFCITELDVGGAERALVQIVTRLDPAEFRPTVICLGPEAPLCKPLRDAGIEVICLYAQSASDVGIVFRLQKELRRLKPVLLQTFLFHANMLGRIAAWMARVPVVISGIRVAEKRSPWYLRIDRWTNFLVKQNICVSESVAKFSIEQGGLNPEKVVVIPNGVDFDRFANALPADLSKEFNIPGGSRVMIFVGRLDPQKGIRGLIEATEPVLLDSPDVHLLIVGEGSERPWLQRTIAESDADSQIHLVGFRGDIPELLRECDLLVLPSVWEGMPNVLLEAMAAALPVVATDVEGVSELLDGGEHGTIVASKRTDALSAAIRNLLSDQGLRERLARSSQTHCEKHFTIDASAKKYAEIYREWVSQRLKK